MVEYVGFLARKPNASPTCVTPELAALVGMDAQVSGHVRRVTKLRYWSASAASGAAEE